MHLLGTKHSLLLSIRNNAPFNVNVLIDRQTFLSYKFTLSHKEVILFPITLRDRFVFQSSDSRQNLVVYRKDLGVYKKEFVGIEFGGQVGKLLEIEVSEGMRLIDDHCVWIGLNSKLGAHVTTIELFISFKHD